MSVVLVKPLNNLIVRHPNTKAIVPPEGVLVDLDSGVEGTYWKRRISDGSLAIVVDAPKVHEGAVLPRKKGGDK